MQGLLGAMTHIPQDAPWTKNKNTCICINGLGLGISTKDIKDFSKHHFKVNFVVSEEDFKDFACIYYYVKC